MGTDEKPPLVDTSIPCGERTRRLDMLDAISQLQRDTETPEIAVVEPAIKTYPLIKTRRRWDQRFLRWLKDSR